MESVWVVVSVILAVIVLALLARLILVKKSAREICEKLPEILSGDTNILIDISSRDRDMRGLADCVNKQLAALRRERLRCIQGDRELKAAVTAISHDLRTPLTAICGYLELMKREEKPERVARSLDIIEDRAALMKQLTEELFRYSVIAGESADAQTESVIINSVLEDSVMGFYAALCERRIEPVIRITQRQVVRQLNRAALSRVFANLIGNALKYSDGDLSIVLDDDGVVTF